MSPEQVAGNTLDRRSDIFSLGSLLHELLSGRRAFDSEVPAETLMAIVASSPEPLHRLVPGLSPQLVEIVETCLRRVRSERYPRAGDAAAVLELERKRLVDEGVGKTTLRDYLQQHFAIRQMQIDKALYSLEEGFRSDDPGACDSVTVVQEAPFSVVSADLEPGPDEPAPESWTGQTSGTPTPAMRPRTVSSSPPLRTVPVAAVETRRSGLSMGWLVALTVVFGLALGLSVALIAWILSK